MYSIGIGSDYMWNKIELYAKRIFDWCINAFVYMALICGYILFCLELERYFTGEISTVSLILGAFIYGYYLYIHEIK